MSKLPELAPFVSVMRPPSKKKVGLYRAKCCYPNCEWALHYSWWNGEWFNGLWRTKDIAVKNIGAPHDDSMTHWQGVLK